MCDRSELVDYVPSCTFPGAPPDMAFPRKCSSHFVLNVHKLQVHIPCMPCMCMCMCMYHACTMHIYHDHAYTMHANLAAVTPMIMSCLPAAGGRRK